MATKKNETVSLLIPRVPGDDSPNFFVGINGKNYLIPKGKTVEVPKEVAEEYHRAMRAHGFSLDHVEKMNQEMREKEKLSEAAAAADAASR